MDCSNPVNVNDRITVGDARIAAAGYIRQDLASLKNAAAQVPRNYLPTSTPRPPDVVRADLLRVKSSRRAVPNDPEGLVALQDLSDFLTLEAESIPICGYVGPQGSVHPSGVKMKLGRSLATRTFGGQTRDDIVLEAALRHFPYMDVAAAYSSAVYTSGTPSGFLERMRLNMTRPAVSSLRTAGVRTVAQLAGLMEKLLPIRKAPVPDWNADFDVLLDDVEITKEAGAGYPYCRSKGQAMRDCLEVVLPNIVEAVTTGTWEQLMTDQPELFLVEVKNKLDTYDTEKLLTKTRPYMNYPMHFTLFWSFMAQHYNELMYVVGDGPPTSNACGWSMAGGGGLKKIKYIQTQLKKEGDWFVEAYSDDVVIYYKQHGEIYRISPDFVQMDSSIDADIVRARLYNIRKLFKEQHGDNVWMESMIDLWEDMALDPMLIVQGTKIWRKKAKHGMCSGVPDTTGINTYKSVLAYHKMLESHDPRTLTEDVARKWMRNHAGLEIKAGTWTVEQANFMAPPGEPMCPQTFLGVQWMNTEEGAVVPHLSTEKWLRMLVVPKDKDMDTYSLSAARRRFDRMRGYLVTGAAFDPRIVDVINDVLNGITAEAVIMQVQAGNGRGEAPQEGLLLPDFVFPASDVVPSRANVVEIYSGGARSAWTELFPGVKVLISGHMELNMRKFGKITPYRARLAGTGEGRTTDVMVLQPPEAFATPADNPGISGASYKKGKRTKPGSKCKVVLPDGAQGATMPTVEDTIDHILRETALPLPLLAERIGKDPHEAIKFVYNAGYDAREPLLGLKTEAQGPALHSQFPIKERARVLDTKVLEDGKTTVPITRPDTRTTPLRGTVVLEEFNGEAVAPPRDVKVIHHPKVTSSALVGDPVSYMVHLLTKATGETGSWTTSTVPTRVESGTAVLFHAEYTHAGFIARAVANSIRRAKSFASRVMIDKLIREHGVPLPSAYLPPTPTQVMEAAANARAESLKAHNNPSWRTAQNNQAKLDGAQQRLAQVDERLTSRLGGQPPLETLLIERFEKLSALLTDRLSDAIQQSRGISLEVEALDSRKKSKTKTKKSSRRYDISSQNHTKNSDHDETYQEETHYEDYGEGTSRRYDQPHHETARSKKKGVRRRGGR
ncbi:RdRp [Hubei permutotetra-like virus 4]|uniref:RdRp n=1 Tax=Hubei permutotetra-like virus 4 TaxID=1923078 RepID=UPI00090C486F|nr:RdRp [Hubei permutotetra-like virus 4]APG76938.1 RdRp [Hubei permutotetra-like virus 4]